MTASQIENNVLVEHIGQINLADTLDCGQAFRWRPLSDGSFEGVVEGRYIRVCEFDKGILFYDMDLETFDKIFRDYFDLDRDYEQIKAVLSKNEILKKAAEFAGGIKVLRQEPWECLCSFIISQNNNIPRIKGIIERLCESFGEPVGNGLYSFPSAEKIAALTLEDLAPLRSGFRAKYILDAAKKVASGEVDLEKISNMKSDDAREELMKIYGVGEKVADCVLLFSMGHINVIPKDVWIKRVLSTLFNGELPHFAAQYAGIAQQYLFHYARMTKLEI